MFKLGIFTIFTHVMLGDLLYANLFSQYLVTSLLTQLGEGVGLTGGNEERLMSGS